MKISNEDLCKLLKKENGKDWQFCMTSHTQKNGIVVYMPTFYVKGEKQINITPSMPVENKNSSKIWSIVDSFDWAKAYKSKSLRIHAKDENGKYEHRKEFLYDHKNTFRFIIPKEIESVLEKTLNKNKYADRTR